jgi:restriction system protein
MTTFWVVRTGKSGERTQWSLDNNICGGGWHEIPDLTGVHDKEALRRIVEQHMPNVSKNALAGYVGQLWSLIDRIQIGDYIVLPIRSTSQLVFGKVTKGYEYLANEPDDAKRHVIGGVDWLEKPVPKSAIKQDLLYQLGGMLTVFKVQNNDAEWRLGQIVETGKDPGARTDYSVGKPVQPPKQTTTVEETEFESQASMDLETVANDEIGRRIQEDFKGHALSELIEAILTAEGFTCLNSPPGADGGVDLLAGRGPLGMDSPRVVVQVKSQMTTVSSEVVSQLLGVMNNYSADQALLVALGGITAPAKREHKNQWFKFRLWTLETVVEAVYRNYDVLPSEIQAKLPLKRIWVPIPVDDLI